MTSQQVAWANGTVFASDPSGSFDFWVRAEYPRKSFGFVVSWTAEYWDSGEGNYVECSGTLGPVTVQSGLDRRLVVNAALAGVKLHSKQQVVRRTLGPPVRVTHKFDRAIRVYVYKKWNLRVWFYKTARGVWKVQSVRTSSALFKTRQGIGVGSTFRALKRRHTGFRCFLGQSAWQMCLSRQLAPRPTTIFEGRFGRIRSASLTLTGD